MSLLCTLLQREYTSTNRSDFAAPPQEALRTERRPRFGMVTPDTMNEAAYA
jgi:hypothetical protein